MKNGLVAFFLLAALSAMGQQDTIQTNSPFESPLNLIAAYRGDSVVLRWAPASPGAWNEAKKAGFVISRTVLQDDGTFDPATFRPLTSTPLKPWPLEQWATIAGQNSKDDYAKIAAQALYGQNFSTASGFVPQADEFVTRFSFTMLAADLSINAATALGLRYADKSVEKGKVYIYRVESLVDTTKYVVLPGVVSVNTSQPEVIPAAVIDKVIEKENVIELRWNRDFHNLYFSAYFIERSDDGGRTFKRLNKLPYIHADEEKNPVEAQHIVYIDSVQANYKSYQYRVIGITPFGEVGPPSNGVKGMGRDRTPPMAPQKVQAKHAGGSRVRITWEYPRSKELRGFLIGRGNNPAKQFEPLMTEPLPPNTRSFIDEHANELASNYYIVAAVDTSGNASLSLAQYAMIIDSIPPAPPTGLSGEIDSTGHVTVRWKLGAEQDIQGYLVFFSNSPDHEFSQLTHGPLQDTVFQDTITLKTLTKKIYYKVVAVDYNSNYSGFSEMLTLKRPDIVPPSAAVFDRYRVTEKGIELVWVPSSSEDLSKTVLARMDDNNTWREIATFGVGGATSFTDTVRLKPGQFYSYSLLSVDEDNLSRRSMPIRLKYVDLTQGQPVNNLFANADKDEKKIFVNWTYPVKGDYRFVLYRAVNGSSFTSYKTLRGSITTFNDTDVREGSTYEYSVGVIFKDGRKAPFGKVVKTPL